MLAHPSSGDNIFYKVRDANFIDPAVTKKVKDGINGLERRQR